MQSGALNWECANKRKTWDLKLQDKETRVENAGSENVEPNSLRRPKWNWKTQKNILSIIALYYLVLSTNLLTSANDNCRVRCAAERRRRRCDKNSVGEQRSGGPHNAWYDPPRRRLLAAVTGPLWPSARRPDRPCNGQCPATAVRRHCMSWNVQERRRLPDNSHVDHHVCSAAVVRWQHLPLYPAAVNHHPLS